MLVLHISMLEDEAIAKQVYKEQIRNHWPGLAQETKINCQKLNIQDVNVTQMSRTEYRKVVLAACHKYNEDKLRSQAKGKCERIRDEDYGKKEYTLNSNIHKVRQRFRSRFGLLPFAGNYSKDQRFSRSDWLCKCKEARKEESHLTSGRCAVYGDLTMKYSNFTDDDNLVQFFAEVLARRDQLDLITSGSGGDTTDGTNPATTVQDKPV